MPRGYPRVMTEATREPPYQRIARFYDAIYEAKGRESQAEIAYLARFWSEDGHGPGNRTLLDVGCGTGAHLGALSEHGRVEGLDLSMDMIAEARRRYPSVPLHLGDLKAFQLNRRFDVVSCLFGSAGYLPTRPALRRAISSMGMHVAPGGVLLVEPPILTDTLGSPRSQRLQTEFEGGLLVRTTETRIDGGVLEIDFDWCFTPGSGSPEETIQERHRLLLLGSKDWMADMKRALPKGTRVEFDPEGPGGRGLLIAHVSRGGVPGSG